MTQLLTLRETAERLRVSESALRQWRLRGQDPPSIRLGRRVMYRTEAIDAWLEERELAAEALRSELVDVFAERDDGPLKRLSARVDELVAEHGAEDIAAVIRDDPECRRIAAEMHRAGREWDRKVFDLVVQHAGDHLMEPGLLEQLRRQLDLDEEGQ